MIIGSGFGFFSLGGCIGVSNVVVVIGGGGVGVSVGVGISVDVGGCE